VEEKQDEKRFEKMVMEKSTLPETKPDYFSIESSIQRTSNINKRNFSVSTTKPLQPEKRVVFFGSNSVDGDNNKMGTLVKGKSL
jgi:hypothetical protein